MTKTLALPVAVTETALPSAAQDGAKPVAHAAMPFPMKRLALMSAWASRAANSCGDTAKLFALGLDGGSWAEIYAMQQAMLRQLSLQGEEMQRGLVAWSRDWAEIKGANTMSKLAEQEFNLIGQLGQLYSDQATDLVNLLESTQIGYAFWVSEKLAE